MHHDSASIEQSVQPDPRHDGEPALGVALRMMQFRRVDVGNADARAVDSDSVGGEGEGENREEHGRTPS